MGRDSLFILNRTSKWVYSCIFCANHGHPTYGRNVTGWCRQLTKTGLGHCRPSSVWPLFLTLKRCISSTPHAHLPFLLHFLNGTTSWNPPPTCFSAKGAAGRQVSNGMCLELPFAQSVTFSWGKQCENWKDPSFQHILPSMLCLRLADCAWGCYCPTFRRQLDKMVRNGSQEEGVCSPPQFIFLI